MSNLHTLHIEDCPSDLVANLNEQLEDWGALSVTLTDRFDDQILEPELGTVPLWPHVEIAALFADLDEAQQLLQHLSSQFPTLTMHLVAVLDEDWERTCLVDLKPQLFGERLWICPSWITPPDPSAVTLILDPGLAFGTGTHPTTSLCLTWLATTDLTNKSIIDYGCGSGILALSALKLGAMHAQAIDIDEQALVATQNNAHNNAILAETLTLNLPDKHHQPAHVLMANILLTPLLALKDHFHSLLLKSGTLVVSGLLAEQVDDIIAAYNTKFIHEYSKFEGDWALVVFSPRSLN